MKITFINDHRFYVDADHKVFTSGTLSADVWSRFTANFGALTVIGRGVRIDNQAHQHAISSTNHVTFDLLYDVHGGADYFKKRKEIIQKLKPYILDSNFIVLRLPSNIGVIAAELCRKYHKKYFVEIVGCAFDSMWYFGNMQGKIMAPYSALLNKRVIKNADAAVYVTQDFLQKRYPTTAPKINASNVVIDNFEDEILEKHLNNVDLSKYLKIGMIGNVALPYKGYEILFKALSRLHLDYTLEIVGGGEKQWITNLIAKYGLQNHVKLLGRINDRQRLYDFLDSLDLYVQPSLTEGLPRSVIEAMARACPIIASKAGGIPELINPAYVYNVKNDQHLAQLIMKVASDKTILKDMSRENFLKSKNYTFEKINERRYEFFKQIKQQINNK